MVEVYDVFEKQHVANGKRHNLFKIGRRFRNHVGG